MRKFEDVFLSELEKVAQNGRVHPLMGILKMLGRGAGRGIVGGGLGAMLGGSAGVLTGADVPDNMQDHVSTHQYAGELADMPAAEAERYNQALQSIANMTPEAGMAAGGTFGGIGGALGGGGMGALTGLLSKKNWQK